MHSTLVVATETFAQQGPASEASWATVNTAGLVALRPQQLMALADRDAPVEISRMHFASRSASNSSQTAAVATHTETDPPEDPGGPATLINFPEFTPIRTFPQAFVILAEWEGSVLTIEYDKVTAQLTPIAGIELFAQTEAEVPFDEISEDDRELICIGALFRLAIGYEISNGTRTRFSRVIFRRLPAWTRRELDASDALAEKYFNGVPVE